MVTKQIYSPITELHQGKFNGESLIQCGTSPLEQLYSRDSSIIQSRKNILIIFVSITSMKGTLFGSKTPRGKELPYERGGDARGLLRGVNFSFWSHLGCSGQNTLYLAVKVSFRVALGRNIKKLYILNSSYLLDSCNQRLK